MVTISGIELAEKIKKGQFKTGKLGGCHAPMTELRNAALVRAETMYPECQKKVEDQKET